MAKDTDNVEILSTKNWTPEQALLAAMKTPSKWSSIVILGEVDDDGRVGIITAGTDVKTLMFLSEILRRRGLQMVD